MKTMDNCIEVWKLHFKDGLSERAISRGTGINRTTVRKILAQGTAPKYRRSKPVARPKLDAFLAIIDGMLESDKTAPRKQRHTAKRIFDRLREENGYTGGYTQVKCYVRECRNKTREAYIPLEFGPAEAQVDWGEAIVIVDGNPQKAHMFIMTLPFSNVRFAACFPSQKMEYFLEGHTRAFEFLGGVPKRIIYDNLKSAVSAVGPGRHRECNKTFERFCRTHLFDPDFCNVRSGNEKGSVENAVGWVRRNCFVPEPDFSDWESFNAILSERCRSAFSLRRRGDEGTVGERFEEEHPHLLPWTPSNWADPKARKANSECLVRFDDNDYSVPCRWAHHDVTVRNDVGKVRIYVEGECVATHTRCHGREQAVYDPLHYLPLVERKPRALDYGAPLKELVLPECFQTLRCRMETGQTHTKGTREYIRVLNLLNEKHSLPELTRAVERALALGVTKEEGILNLLLCPPESSPPPLDLKERQHLANYNIAAPSASVYSVLVQGGAI